MRGTRLKVWSDRKQADRYTRNPATKRRTPFCAGKPVTTAHIALHSARPSHSPTTNSTGKKHHYHYTNTNDIRIAIQPSMTEPKKQTETKNAGARTWYHHRISRNQSKSGAGVVCLLTGVSLGWTGSDRTLYSPSPSMRSISSSEILDRPATQLPSV